ncbi:hypothetical protein [Pseudobdellovibrio sp. HCB154]
MNSGFCNNSVTKRQHRFNNLT